MNKIFIDGNPVCFDCWQRCHDWFSYRNLIGLRVFDLTTGAFPVWYKLQDTDRPCSHSKQPILHWQVVPSKWGGESKIPLFPKESGLPWYEVQELQMKKKEKKKRQKSLTE